MSVWVEINGIDTTAYADYSHAPRERVNWNLFILLYIRLPDRHAPRERVSWNSLIRSECFHRDRHAPRERVSWNHICVLLVLISVVTLHVSVWVEMILWAFCKYSFASRSTWACELKYLHCKNSRHRLESRSTWACELKLQTWPPRMTAWRHAPRERVSWNLQRPYTRLDECASRSTWACELKWISPPHSWKSEGHAPRERVSWNDVPQEIIGY